uniref:Tumor protein D52 n=1 Tax=Monodon monoceros TaxID=40151 RepID=A0A8C6AKY4_MONMO
MDSREMDFYEDYQSPFDFNAGVNRNYLYLYPSGNTSPPGSPTLQKFGLLRTDPVPEEGEDVVATISATETLSEEEREELRRELAKVEEEIQTLSQVLAAKEKHLTEIKRKLGINSLQELKQNIAKGWQDVTATSAYVPLILHCSRNCKGHFALFVWGRDRKALRTFLQLFSVLRRALPVPPPVPPFSSVSDPSLTSVFQTVLGNRKKTSLIRELKK